MVIMWMILPLLYYSGEFYYKPRSLSSISQRLNTLTQRLNDITVNKRSLIIIDGDNVRGKTSFQIGKETLCYDVAKWMNLYNLQSRVCIVFDHAENQQAFYLQDSNGLSIIFSGPDKTADDIIARDVGWIQENLFCNVIVVTEDHQLRKRCRNASISSRLNKKKLSQKSTDKSVDTSTLELTTISSPQLVELLYEKLSSRQYNELYPTVMVPSMPMLLESNDSMIRKSSSQKGKLKVSRYKKAFHELSRNDSITPRSYVDINHEIVEMMKKEVDFRRQIHHLKTQLTSCKSKPLRSSLRSRIDQLEYKLAQTIGDSHDSFIIARIDNDDEDDHSDHHDFNPPDAVDGSLSSESTTLPINTTEILRLPSFDVIHRGNHLIQEFLVESRKSCGSVEDTWERIVLSERMRHTLDTYGRFEPTMTVNTTEQNAAVMSEQMNISFIEYVNYFNRVSTSISKL